MTSRASISKERQWQFLDAAIPVVMLTTSATALKNFTALSQLLVQRWSEQWMPAATLLRNRRAPRMESFSAARLTRTTRLMTLLTVRQIGFPKSKARACHCDLSHIQFLNIFLCSIRKH